MKTKRYNFTDVIIGFACPYDMDKRIIEEGKRLEGEYITCTDFIDEYRKYCKDNGSPEKSNKAIGLEMTKLGFPSEQRRIGYNRKVYANLKWKGGI